VIGGGRGVCDGLSPCKPPDRLPSIIGMYLDSEPLMYVPVRGDDDGLRTELAEVLTERGVPAPALTAMRLLRDGGLEDAFQSLQLILVTCMEEARHRTRMRKDHQELWNGLVGSRPENQGTAGRRVAAADVDACSRMPALPPSPGIDAKRLRLSQAAPKLSEPHMRFGVAAKEVGVGRAKRDRLFPRIITGADSRKRGLDGRDGPRSSLQPRASHNIDYV
jgi:hypothetical protein